MSGAQLIVIRDDFAAAEIHPDQGAAVGRYDIVRPGGEVLPVFQTSPHPRRAGPYALGLNLLIPFSNRISGGGFWHEGTFYRLERNTAGPHPIHGNAFEAAWTVRESTATSATLDLHSEGPGPFRYDAAVTYSLLAGALYTRLVIKNLASKSLPFGAGFHPWFVRTAETRLTMRTAGYWTETADHLPDRFVVTRDDPEFDFSRPKRLPSTWMNTAFTGWEREATLTYPDRKLAVEITAEEPLTTVIAYSPSDAPDFVCVEPVSHSVDAHNRTGPGTAPLQVLEPGAVLTVEATIRPYAI